MSVSQPTRTNLGIRSASDAFTLFEAVRQGVLPLRRHRLSQAERDNLASGQVFVWIESSEADGLERWTDGRKWSPSRTRDVFLVYEERDEPSVDESLEKASRRINTYFSGPTGQGSEELFGIFAFPKERPPKPDGLMKQTFSAWVLNPSTGQRVKWHMSAYLSRTRGAELPTVQDDPLLRSMQAPVGIFECCTGPRKHRKPFANFQEGENGNSAALRQASDDAAPSRRYAASSGSDLIGPRSRSSAHGVKHGQAPLSVSTLTSFSLPSPPSSPTWNMKPLSPSQEDLSNRIIHLNGSRAVNTLSATNLSNPPKDEVVPESRMAGQLTPISTPRPTMSPEGHEASPFEIRTRHHSQNYTQRGSPMQSPNLTREHTQISASSPYPTMDGLEVRRTPSRDHYGAQQNLVYSPHGSSISPASLSTPISYTPRTASDREALASFGQLF